MKFTSIVSFCEKTKSATGFCAQNKINFAAVHQTFLINDCEMSPHSTSKVMIFDFLLLLFTFFLGLLAGVLQQANHVVVIM